MWDSSCSKDSYDFSRNSQKVFSELIMSWSTWIWHFCRTKTMAFLRGPKQVVTSSLGGVSLWGLLGFPWNIAQRWEVTHAMFNTSPLERWGDDLKCWWYQTICLQDQSINVQPIYWCTYWCIKVSYIHLTYWWYQNATPPKFNSSPLKHGDWKTRLSYWGPVTFQGLC